MQMIADFGESRFPCNFGEWQGIGAASKKGLEAHGITEPVQLLGHFLMLKKDPATFDALLDKAGVVAASARSIRAQLQEWCQIHDVRAEYECRAQAQAAASTNHAAQLQEWCQIHGVSVEYECKGQAQAEASTNHAGAPRPRSASPNVPTKATTATTQVTKWLTD
jgi:hypothetical protein